MPSPEEPATLPVTSGNHASIYGPTIAEQEVRLPFTDRQELKRQPMLDGRTLTGLELLQLEPQYGSSRTRVRQVESRPRGALSSGHFGQSRLYRFAASSWQIGLRICRLTLMALVLFLIA
jgi:hypothetical protein